MGIFLLSNLSVSGDCNRYYCNLNATQVPTWEEWSNLLRDDHFTLAEKVEATAARGREALATLKADGEAGLMLQFLLVVANGRMELLRLALEFTADPHVMSALVTEVEEDIEKVRGMLSLHVPWNRLEFCRVFQRNWFFSVNYVNVQLWT